MELAGKTVLLLGLKRTGVSVARFVARRGARVRVVERLGQEALRPELARLVDVPLDWSSDADSLDALAEVDLVVPSPGVPKMTPLLVAAVDQGIPVWSEIELAYRFFRGSILAVTGTNGKSTTTALVGEMLRQGGQVFVGGNLGTPLIEAVDHDYVVAVAEVSSFQLEWVEQFRPHIGLFLNLSEDHLDRHGSLTAYGMAKRRLLTAQTRTDWAVVNRDDPRVSTLTQNLASQLFSFGWQAVVDEGTWIDAGTLVVRHRGHEECYGLDQLRLSGRHNLENVMAAVSAATLWGVSSTVIASVLTTFSGLPHRLELVRTKNGVAYVDDSKGTNIGAVVQALASFESPVILLAGGVEKGGDYNPLRMMVRTKVKKLILFGQARQTLQAVLGQETETVLVDTLAQAVKVAQETAQAGDTVLLSPACASFDQFRDYAHRGRVFHECIEQL